MSGNSSEGSSFEGQFRGYEELESVRFIFGNEDIDLIATVEGKKMPTPEVGDIVTFGRGKIVRNHVEDEFDDELNSGVQYRVTKRVFMFGKQSVEYEDKIFGPLNRQIATNRLTTTVVFEVSEIGSD